MVITIQASLPIYFDTRFPTLICAPKYASSDYLNHILKRHPELSWIKLLCLSLADGQYYAMEGFERKFCSAIKLNEMSASIARTLFQTCCNKKKCNPKADPLLSTLCHVCFYAIICVSVTRSLTAAHDLKTISGICHFYSNTTNLLEVNIP